MDEVELLRASPHSRMVGGTEFSWCKAVSGGTGTTVLALLLQAETVPPSLLQAALLHLQSVHPRLRSRLVWIRGRPALSVSPIPYANLQVLPVHEQAQVEMDMIDEAVDDVEHEESWLRLVEGELNNNYEWREQYNCLEPQPMMALRLYVGIPPSPSRQEGECENSSPQSLLVLRLHTAICDRVSAATILTELLHTIARLRSEFPSGMEVSSDSCVNLGFKHDEEQLNVSLPAIEDIIPKGQADKPFWAHGLDIVGYSLGSKRHAMLPFLDTEQSKRRSRVIRQKLSEIDTLKLLKECCAQRTSRAGALTAAALKATAVVKKLGGRSEHYAVVTLLDCRNRLDPVLRKSTVGFYHSAVLNTHVVQGEGVEFWELARRCSEAVDGAVKRRKHFTDMGDVGLLMCQAIQMPQLTPWGSLRTSTLVVFEEMVEAEADEASAVARQSAGLLDFVGCSSIHGVGPSIALFDLLHQGSLYYTCVYPSPLHSRSQITLLLDTMMGILLNSL